MSSVKLRPWQAKAISKCKNWFLVDKNKRFLINAAPGSGKTICATVIAKELIEKKYVELVQGFIINKFRGDIEILKPGYRKLKQKTGLPVFGTIPMTDFIIPDEDSIGNSPKKLNWNSSNLKKLDSEINKISKVVKSSLNIRQVEKLLK